jgi:hypothetical protein
MVCGAGIENAFQTVTTGHLGHPGETQVLRILQIRHTVVSGRDVPGGGKKGEHSKL